MNGALRAVKMLYTWYACAWPVRSTWQALHLLSLEIKPSYLRPSDHAIHVYYSELRLRFELGLGLASSALHAFSDASSRSVLLPYVGGKVGFPMDSATRTKAYLIKQTKMWTCPLNSSSVWCHTKININAVIPSSGETWSVLARGALLRAKWRTFASKLISHISPFRPELGPLASTDHVSPDEGKAWDISDL